MSRKKAEAEVAGISLYDTQHQMKRRQSFHDYYTKGTYMVTLVVADRQPLLGRLVTEAAEPDLRARVELSPLGQAILDEEVLKISAHYPMVEVWKLCLMPDHLHIILRVREEMPKGKHLGHVIRGFKAGCTQAWWRLGGGRPAAPANGPANGPAVETAGTWAAAGTGAAAGTQAGTRAAAGTGAAAAAGPVPAPAQVPCVSTQGGVQAAGSLFEWGYNDKILTRAGQLENWKHYLDDNPRRLAVKRLHPELFVTTHYADLAEWHCQMVGNRFLLDIPQKMAVIVHRAYSDEEYAAWKAEWLSCGEAGGVLVSAAIAQREKAVLREALDRGYRIILLRENGFPPLYKPTGESFDACSEGRLLQISPWEYHFDRRVISREQCLKLNRLAEFIANN